MTLITDSPKKTTNRSSEQAGSDNVVSINSSGNTKNSSENTNTTYRIVTSITQAIVKRQLMPGTKLSEQKLANIYGVSRTLVRQALNQLSRDHLVTLTPARGAHVATPSVEEAQQVFEVRNLLESALVDQLTTRITDEQLNDLRAHLKLEANAIEQHDVSERTRLLGEFHVLLAKQHGNAVLAELLLDLLNRSSLIALMYQSSSSAERSHQEHVALVDALAHRDSQTVKDLMSQHLHNVESQLRFDTQPSDLSAVLTRFN